MSAILCSLDLCNFIYSIIFLERLVAVCTIAHQSFKRSQSNTALRARCLLDGECHQQLYRPTLTNTTTH